MLRNYNNIFVTTNDDEALVFCEIEAFAYCSAGVRK